jgi:FeS assembly protein IscX
MSVDWNDAETLALLLQESYPDVDPRQLEFAELSEMIAALPGAGDRTQPLDDKILEAIQTAWYEEFEEDET